MNVFVRLSTLITILLVPNMSNFISNGSIVKSIMGREERRANTKQEKVCGEFTCASLNFTVNSLTFKSLQASFCVFFGGGEGNLNKQ